MQDGKNKCEDTTGQKSYQMLKEYTRHETLVGKGFTWTQNKTHC